MKIWLATDNEIYDKYMNPRLELFYEDEHKHMQGMFCNVNCGVIGIVGYSSKDSCELAAALSEEALRSRKTVRIINGEELKMKTMVLELDVPEDVLCEEFKVLRLEDSSIKWCNFISRYCHYDDSQNVPFDIVIGKIPSTWDEVLNRQIDPMMNEYKKYWDDESRLNVVKMYKEKGFDYSGVPDILWVNAYGNCIKQTKCDGRIIKEYPRNLERFLNLAKEYVVSKTYVDKEMYTRVYNRVTTEIDDRAGIFEYITSPEDIDWEW